MKLAEILKYLEQLVPGSVSKADLGNIPILSGTNLNNPLLYQMIRSVDEFKECELKILGQPTKKSKTMLVREGLKLKGNVHLWNITLTPSVFSFKDITTPVKNDSLITPLTYSPEEFIAYKSIVMRYNTETLQDRTKLVPTDADNEFRLTLHQRLDTY